MKRILEGKPDETAFLASNDLSALECSVPARKCRLGSRDISITGYDNYPETKFYNPPLTTISQGLETLGVEAVHSLISIMNKKNPV